MSSELCKGCSTGFSNASIHGHGDASVLGPNDADRRGRLPYGIPVFYEPPQFEATTITQAHHTRVLHDDQRQRAARIFRDLETAFAGTPSFTAASQSRTVGPSTAPRTTLSAGAAANLKPVVNPSAVAQGPSTTPSPRPSCAAGGTNRCVCWAVRTRSCVKEKCSFKSKGMVNLVVIRRCVAGSSRNYCEEVTGGTSCTMKPPRRLEVLARATSSTHKSTLSSMVCHQQAKVEFSGQGFLDSMNGS